MRLFSVQIASSANGKKTVPKNAQRNWSARHSVLNVNKQKFSANGAQRLPFSTWLKYLNVKKKIDKGNISVFKRLKIVSTKQ